MTYELEFDRRALREWHKLDTTIRKQFKNKLDGLLHRPCVEANKLGHLPGCYKVKLRSSGYRMIYQVLEQELVVLVVAIGKREKNKVYKQATARLPAKN